MGYGKQPRRRAGIGSYQSQQCTDHVEKYHAEEGPGARGGSDLERCHEIAQTVGPEKGGDDARRRDPTVPVSGPNEGEKGRGGDHKATENGKEDDEERR